MKINDAKRIHFGMGTRCDKDHFNYIRKDSKFVMEIFSRNLLLCSSSSGHFHFHLKFNTVGHRFGCRMKYQRIKTWWKLCHCRQVKKRKYFFRFYNFNFYFIIKEKFLTEKMWATKSERSRRLFRSKHWPNTPYASLKLNGLKNISLSVLNR